jgi:beta-glucosidase
VITPGPRTDMGWEVRPTALRTLLGRVARDYRPGRIYITENGAAYTDVADADGVIRDQRRIDFLRGHLLATHGAIADGVPVAGYFHWSLLDNFEWGYGFSKRFGLFEVDFPSSRRVPRASAHFYRDVVSTSSVEPDDASSSP